MITDPMIIGTIIKPPGIRSILRLMGICMVADCVPTQKMRSKV